MSEVRYIAQTRVVLGKNGLRDRRIVFYLRPTDIMPFVVHTEVFDHNGKMWRHQGDYNDSFEDGWNDFVRRARQLLEEEFCDV